MRKQLITSIIILMCFMAVVATRVTGQSVQRFEVNIPFQTGPSPQ